MAVKIEIPISLEHVYNTHDRATNIGYGLGWRLNYSQTIQKVVLGTKTYYRLIDGDGTRLYYRSVNATQYVSDLDMESTLTIDAVRKRITIADKAGNKLTFACDSGQTTGRLIREEDANGNAIVIEYIDADVANLRIAALKEAHVIYAGNADAVAVGSGRVTLSYTNNLLSAVAPTNGLNVSYSYTGSRLTGIEYADGERTVYAYDAQGNVTSAENVDGYKISYTYSGNDNACVRKVFESNAGIEHQLFQFSYGWNRTTVYDGYGDSGPKRSTTYHFDSMGKPISMRDIEGGARYAAYNAGDRTTTQLSAASKLQKTNVNVLQNHGFERAGVWTYGTGATRSDAYRYTGKYCLQLNNTTSTMSAYVTQTVTVIPGKRYTLSAYFSGVSNGIVEALVGSTVRADCDPVQTTGTTGTDWWCGRVSFYASSSSDQLTIRVRLPEGNVGAVYVDAIQLERGVNMGHYNMLENSDFQLGNAGNYIAGSNNGPNCVVTTTSDSSHPDYLDNHVFCLEGGFWHDRYIYQAIDTVGSAGDTYTFGCWFQCYGIPVSGTRNVKRISLKFYNGGTVVNTQAVDMDLDTDEWQFVAGTATAAGAYTQIQLYIEYNKTRNNAYFDGLFLCKEQFANTYGYDAKGNLNAVKSVIAQTVTAQYDAGDNLTRLTNPLGNASTFTYDGKHNLLTSTSAESLRSANTYNSRGQLTSTRLGSTTNYINSTTVYDANTGLPVTVRDARGNAIQYAYNSATRLLTSVTDARDNASSNTYAGPGGMLKLQSTRAPTGTGSELAEVTYGYDKDRLTSISRNYGTAQSPALTVYAFAYDHFGRVTETKIGGTTLCENVYSTVGLLAETIYATGFAARYTYDGMNRLEQVHHRRDAESAYELVFQYFYDADGNLETAEDRRSATKSDTVYDYDLSGRLMRSSRYDDDDQMLSSYRYEYDHNNNLSKLRQMAAGRSWDLIYSYDRDDRPVSVVSSGMATVTDAYDAVLGLKTSRSLGFSTPYVVSYGYHVNADSTKTALLSSYKNGADTPYTYAYDANGNITEITKGAASASYVYDKANQLIRENDGFSNKTWTYSYDRFGNMLEKVEYAYTTGTLGTPVQTISYTYSTGEWKDLLTGYNGQAITYDAMGNPTSYLGHTLSWTDGRKLESFGSTASYVYSREGTRIQKTVGSAVTNYHYNGSLLMAQTTGNTSQYYSYDANGNLISLYYNNTYYYCLRNGQGDIVGLIDGTGTVVVAYTYDAWGKALSVTGTLASTLGVANPFRYRGYYYDAETGLYYLQSRYYDPAVCRFLNRDVLISTGQGVLGYNGYLYCNNCPVDMKDSAGTVSVSSTSTEETDANGNTYYKVTTTVKGRLRETITTYTITHDGVIQIAMDEPEYRKVFLSMHSRALAEEMYAVAKDINPDFMKGRTVGGLNMELKGHLALYILGKGLNITKVKDKAVVADMGAIRPKESSGVHPDKNAFAFEMLSWIVQGPIVGLSRIGIKKLLK